MGTYKELDPWDLAQKPGYHAEEHYCRSTDGHGHSESMPLKFSPGVQGQMAAIVASGKLPAYRTPQDLVRDAVIHQLHKLGEMLKDRAIQRTVDLNIVLSKIDNLRKMRQEQEAVVTQFREECQSAVEKKDLEQLVELLELGEGAVLSMRSGYLVEMTGLMSTFNKDRAELQAKSDKDFEDELRQMRGSVDDD